MIIKYILVLAFFQGIVFEKTCHGQFHWAKNENDDMKDAVRALLQDIYGAKLQAQVISQGRTWAPTSIFVYNQLKWVIIIEILLIF